jgi:hypothetical protein
VALNPFRLFTLALVVLAAVAGSSGATAQVQDVASRDLTVQSAAADDEALHDTMRKLWEDHITWTRLFIVSFAADLPDQDPTATRLLQNQVDLGDAIKPYIGDAAGDQLTALLTDHILGSVDVLTAAKAGDRAALGVAQERWYANGDAIADFLSAANPEAWPAPMMRAALRQHLDLTTAEAVARLQGDFPGDIAAYDEVHMQILGLSDVLSGGIMGDDHATMTAAFFCALNR